MQQLGEGGGAVIEPSGCLPLPIDGRWRSLQLLKRGQGVETWLAEDGAADSRLVVLKVIAGTALSAAARLRLEHEAHVLARLEDGTVAPRESAGGHGDILYFVRPFIEGVTLRQRLDSAGPLSVQSALRLAVDVLDTLKRAHDLGVLHRDIKPANVIVDETEPMVSAALIDFGLARSTSLDPAIRDELVGTVRYVAPEAAGLLDIGVDERADLYSVGVLLFEAVAGRPPFEGDSVGEILRQHLNTAAPHLPNIGSMVPRALDAVVQRLLRKDPGDRYQTAGAVRADLADISTAIASGTADPVITIGLHDHRRTLTAPAFVGRRAELATIATLVDCARAGQGGLVLLEAESGGGKTRLLEEVALQAAEPELRVLVIRGQGVDHAAQRPFQLLDGIAATISQDFDRDPASVEVLRARLGERAEAVAAAIPALAVPLASRGVHGRPDETVSRSLRNRPDDAAASLGPESFGEARSLTALRSLLAALGDEHRPAVLLLDDCQWADTLTIKLLTHWQQTLRDAPEPTHVVIVAAFRSEEVGPGHGLRSVAPLAHVALGAFGDDDVAQLCESMAGPLPAAAVTTVTRLAEGSPFMASAVLRGLVEAGALRDTPDGWEVDPSLLADVQTSRRAAVFLVRRLELLAPAALTLMSVGAVLGKEFDLDLALELAGLDAAGAVTALEESRRRRILWVDEREGRGSFTHDKLREALLGRMDEQERRTLHLRAAARYETRDPDSVFELAYHFDAAGDGGRAMPYAIEAAELARSRHSLDVAAAHYRIAQRATQAIGAAPTVRATTAEGLADVLTLQGAYEDAIEQLQSAMALTTDHVELSTLSAKLGEVAFKQGQPAEARRHLEGALRQLGRWAPRSAAGFLTGALWELLVQVAHTVAPRLFLARRRASGAEHEFLAMRIYSRLAYVYWFHAGKVPCGWAHLREMNMAERYPETEELAQAYSEHAPVATMIPWYTRGIAYTKRSLAIRRKLGDPWGEGQSLAFYGVVLYAASRYRDCIDQCREAVRLLERTGDKWEENTATWHIAFCHYRLGELGPAVDLARRVYATATVIGDRAAAGISLSAWSRASGGRVPEALIAPLLVETDDAHTACEVHLAEAVRLLHEGSVDRAVEVLRAAVAIIRRAGLRQEYVAPVFPWLATALRMQAEATGPYTRRRTRRRAVRLAVRASRKAARVAGSYANNAPHAQREQGLAEALRGRSRTAARHLERSVVTAARQGAAYEEALSRLALARIVGDAAELASAERIVAAIEAPVGDVAEPGEEATLSLVDRFSSLLEIGRGIASAPSLSAVYDAVRLASVTLLRGESCHVIDVGGEMGGDLITDSGGNVDELSRRLLGDAIAAGAPVVFGEADPDATESLPLSGVRSILCAPVRCDDEVVACFYVIHRGVEGLFGEDEIRLAEFIATLAGAALEHAAGSEARFRSLAQNSTDVITIVNAAGIVTYLSSSVERVFGFEPAALVGQELRGWIHPDDAEHMLPFLQAAGAADGEPWQEHTAVVECRLRHNDGTWRHVETGLNDLRTDSSVRGFVLNTRDISERVALEAELRSRAWHDGLTGLANRDLFIDRVDHAIARHDRNPGSFGVLFLDLDDFKSVNDSLGHRSGDLLLVSVGRAIERCVRPGDTIARFGGDEFAVLLEDASQMDAEIVADRVMDALAQPHAVMGHEVHARASLGLAMSERGQTAEDLLASADVAMYVAKARGKSRYEVFEPGMGRAALERSILRTDLEWALERDELRVHYQPIVDIVTGAVTGFEALLRWHHPHMGVLAPSSFIELAESSGLIVPIGAWALSQACRQARSWQELIPSAESLSMAVNVSARQLQHHGLVDDVARALRESGLPASSLVLEITESATVQDTEAVMDKLRELKQLGVDIAIDDFGTGYSSFSYLRRFPVDLLKIDKSFVGGLGKDDEDSAIVFSVVGLAHALGLKAVAEGVETVAQLELLAEMGCDLAQGYNWRRPAGEEEVGRWLEQLASSHAADAAASDTPPVTRVVLADDRGSVRAAVRLAMEIDGRFEVVGEAADGAEAVALARQYQPDLVLLDINMPGVSGIEALPGIRAAAPGAGIVLLTVAQAGDLPADVVADALGLFDKALDLDDLVERLSVLMT